MESVEVKFKKDFFPPLTPAIAEGEPFCIAFLITVRVSPAKANAGQSYFNSNPRSLAPLKGTGARVF